MPSNLTPTSPEQRATAIVRALAAASGIPNASIVWSAPNVNAPTPPSMLLSLSGDVPIGIDYVVEQTDLRRPRGQEIKLSAGGTREVILDVQVFTATSIPGGGTSTASGIVNRMISGLLLPSIRYPLWSAGFTPIDNSPVQSIPDIVNAGFRGRALVSIRGTMPAVVASEFVGYIASFSGTATVNQGQTGEQRIGYAVPPKS